MVRPRQRPPGDRCRTGDEVAPVRDHPAQDLGQSPAGRRRGAARPRRPHRGHRQAHPARQGAVRRGRPVGLGPPRDPRPARLPGGLTETTFSRKRPTIWIVPLYVIWFGATLALLVLELASTTFFS